MVRVLRIFAKVWAVLVAAIVLIGYIGILVNEGFGRLQQVMSPFNIVNYVVILLALSPAIGAWVLADKLEKKSSSSNRGAA